MPHIFRTTRPRRTCTVKKADYRQYKDALAADFNNRCGYTDCVDYWFGGKRNFQIDHLKPHSVYPDKKAEYSNLVYCCSYVNRAKSNDDSPNYIDPCDVDYNTHFRRDKDGIIYGVTPQAKYMVSKMHLSLKRYAIIWYLERIEERITLLREKIETRPEIKIALCSILLDYYDFTKKLRCEL